MTSLLITGGSGYLGAELVERSLGRGWEVTATYQQHRPEGQAAHYVAMDLRDAAATVQLICDLQPSLIIHTAYVQSGPDLWSITAEGTAAVARAAYQSGARLVHLSSDVVFDGEHEGRYTEHDAPNPISPYGRAKVYAEQAVAAACQDALIVRTSLIYGGATLSGHERLVLNAADGLAQVSFFRDEQRCPIQVGDLAEALLELAPSDHAGILHLAGADVVSRYHFARMIAVAHGRDPERLANALSPGVAGQRPRNCALDSTHGQALIQTKLRGVSQVFGSAG